MKLQSDLLPALQAACDGELRDFALRWNDTAAVCVVMAARGYPDAPERGSIIRGLDKAGAVPNVTVFHAGTTEDADGTIRAAGGRVLAITGTGATIAEARDTAYKAVAAIDWPEGFCRSDIGWRALVKQ